jgi:hypothetical protein
MPHSKKRLIMHDTQIRTNQRIIDAVANILKKMIKNVTSNPLPYSRIKLESLPVAFSSI